jgi:hypothetical protein
MIALKIGQEVPIHAWANPSDVKCTHIGDVIHALWALLLDEGLYALIRESNGHFFIRREPPAELLKLLWGYRE